MNLKSNIIARLFSDDEVTALKKEVSGQDCLLSGIERILQSRLEDTYPREKDLDKNNYQFRRAFSDGKASEIRWLIEFLSEKEKEQ